MTTCSICEEIPHDRDRLGGPKPETFIGDDLKLWNPYLSAYLTIARHATLQRAHRYAHYEQHGDFPYVTSAEIHRWEGTARSCLTRAFSWAIPWSHAIEAIAKYSPIIEMGAGLGYWANLIEAAGGEIRAFDQHHDEGHYGNEHNNWHRCAPSWYPIVRREANEFEGLNCPKSTLFLCWPPLADPMCQDSVNAYVKEGGKTIIYIGEDDGCTGGWDTANWERIEEHTIPQWEGIHDYLSVWRLK